MSQFMDAIVKPIAGPGLELRRVPVPEPKAGEVLIKIHKTAICGTDVHIYNWDPWAAEHIKHPPMTIGHEYVGEIAKLGEGVTGLQIGQRVSGEGHLTCHRCRNCRSGNIQWCKDTVSVGVDRDGAFAEYVCIPATNVILIDESIDEDVVAFFDAFGNATHTALMFPLIGEDVLITGAGPIGIIAAGICKYAGARRVIITDMNEYRLDLARKMGDVMFDRMEVLIEEARECGLRPFDVVIPVPVNKKRLVKRGYNQSEIMARQFIRRWSAAERAEGAGRPGGASRRGGAGRRDCISTVPRLETKVLIRQKETVMLRSLNPEERRLTLQDAFAVNPALRYRIEGRNILLVDDIYTTGATADSCSRTLLEAGASEVYLLTLCSGGNRKPKGTETQRETNSY